MVKVVKVYICEICKDKFRTMKEAKECEAEGIPKLLPIGLIFALPGNDPMVFAVIKRYPKHYGHHHTYNTWACRDTTAGDNAGGDKYCSHDSWSLRYPPNKKIPSYKRMVKVLKWANIKPLNYVGKKYVVKK